MNLFDAVAQLVAIHNGTRHNARTAHDGSSRDFAWDGFDQLASQPIDLGIGVHLCHFENLLVSRRFYHEEKPLMVQE